MLGCGPADRCVSSSNGRQPTSMNAQHMSCSGGVWFDASVPSAVLLSLERQGVIGGAFVQCWWALFTEWILDRLASAIGVCLDSTRGTQNSAHSTHTGSPGNDCYSTRDARLHSMAAHPIRSQIMLESNVKDCKAFTSQIPLDPATASALKY